MSGKKKKFRMTDIHEICELGDYQFDLLADEDDLKILQMYLMLSRGEKEEVKEIIEEYASCHCVLDDTLNNTIKY